VWIEFAAAVLFAGLGAWLSRVDLELHRLPDIGTGGLVVGIGALWLASGEPQRIQLGVVCAVVTAGVMALGAWAPPHPIGWGDVKLQAGLGLYLGGYHPLLAAAGFVGSLVLGGLAALWLLARGRSAADPLPFGPAMIAAAALVVGGGKSTGII